MDGKNICKECNGKLVKENANNYICQECGKKYKKNRYCDECNEKLELIAGCGAVNFFCNKCNKLKSKKGGIIRYE
ncbi:MAG: zinc-ribbon domain-containing protein [Fusobacteriota bacterium]